MSVALSIGFAGAIANYTDLLAEVQDELDRDDLAAKIPRWIAMAEARLNRLLRTPEMETVIDQITSTENTLLPDDFLQMRTLHCEGSPDRPLRGMSPSALAQEFNGSAGIPTAYCIRGKKVKLAPPPGAEVTLTIDYYAKIPALSVATPENWLLDNHPDVYFFGVLLQAAAYVDDPAKVDQWKAAYDEVIAEIIQASNKARWGSGPLVSNTVKQVRGARC